MGNESPPADEEGASEAPLSDWTRSGAGGSPVPPRAEAGFTPGTILAGRYRVVALLGRGGMGEVYRADDVKLGQPVALKFVRGTLSPETLSRLYAEVRIGRQVSHPSVCRLYDVVEVDGQTFLAMEYVDGEDLASLLARIGRLPADKALDVARDLCAGLAAIHEKGVVHRDLKPANVMIDGRGRARITDFGLAVALEAPGAQAFAGTPVYMSPEQLAGAEVTLRSDLYSVGLILFEMLTGRRFFEARTLEELQGQHREAKGPRLAGALRQLDVGPARAIGECLEEDAAGRPVSARAVLGLLPGADPLDAAVAAGETPSPELVAASGIVGDLGPLAAWTGLLGILGGLVLLGALYDHVGLLKGNWLPRPPEALGARAQEILTRFGPPDQVADTAFGYDWDRTHLDHLIELASSGPVLPRPRPPVGPLVFFYRQSPRKMVAGNRDAMVVRDDPPVDVSGMSEVTLDGRGRLLSFLAVPPQVEPGGPWADPDWPPLFREAGLDPAAFKACAPQWSAPVDSDHKAAWEGRHPDDPGIDLRVEAAAYHGRAVWFAVLPPWAQPTRMVDLRKPVTSPTPVGQTGTLILALALPLGGAYLARRNLQRGRGDLSGGFRVALFVFIAYSIARLFRADHVSAFGDELWVLIKVFAYPSLWAGLVWLLYMALEPYARRRWPYVLISWKRLLRGQFRDPLVGRDVLMGGLAGVFLAVTYFGTIIVADRLALGAIPRDPYVQGSTLSALRQILFRLFVNQFSAVLYGMVFLFMLVLLRVVLRNVWLAGLLWCVLLASPVQAGNANVEWAAGALRAGLFFLVLTRGGLLAFTSALFFMFICVETPFTLDLNAWYLARALPVVIVLAAVSGFAFHVALAGKPLFGRLLED